MQYTQNYKKISALLFACSLLCLPACKKSHKKNTISTKKNTLAQNKINFPLTYDAALQEDDIENLAGLFSDEQQVTTALNQPTAKTPVAGHTANTDFDWADEHTQDNNKFKTIYFDFDKHSIRNDQKEVATYDAVQLKELLAEARQEGKEPLISIEGHACHSAGNDDYNLIKSQNRASTVLNVFKELGVPTENIKVVGRGKEFPVIIEGKKVTGSRTEQWPNRRVEVHIITT